MAKRKTQSNGRASGDGKRKQDDTTDRILYVGISQETRRRYLNYALSVITSRALPDVRDGLKPVQRRIMYVMYHDLHLTADVQTRKCAKICGDTVGNYHPHGDASVYDTLVRMAQNFSLRNPLIDGQGNFGSIMGLPPAAMRYTEARLTPVAAELMSELRFETVSMRPTYDGSRNEPVVLPTRFPNLLVNGTQGIAVGMATSIPPHNLQEVIKACVHLIHHPEATVAHLAKHIKGPDFPLGGRIVTDRRTLRTMYEEGRGSIKVRGEWKVEPGQKGDKPIRLIVYSVPYGVSTSPLLADIGTIINSRKLPQLVDLADETDEKHGLQIVLEIKPGADPESVMAYLYKHTALEQNVSYNSTCLVPGDQDVLVPARLGLVEMLRHFLDFRFGVVRKRFEYQLAQLERRIHILEGFGVIFNDLERALKIIRTSSGKQDAAEKLMAAFPLDAEQTNAILELQLYRISQLEIDRIREELREKQAEAARIRKILGSDKQLWKVVESELQEVGTTFGDKRRTSIGSAEEIAEFDPQAYIVRENTNVIVTRDGWIKRVGRIQNVESTRVREGDSVLDVVPGNTLDHVIFFASDGSAYTLPIEQVPASSGYGEPLAKHVRMRDGVSVVSAFTTDARFVPADNPKSGEAAPSPFLLVATARGQVLRIPFGPFRTPSTKVGRKFCRLAPDDRVVTVELVRDAESMFLASRGARVLHFAISDVPVLSGAGKGVRGIKLDEKDEVLGAVQLSRPSDCLRVENTSGKLLTFGQMKYGITSRGGRGIRTSHRSGFERIVKPPIELVDWNALEQ